MSSITINPEKINAVLLPVLLLKHQYGAEADIQYSLDATNAGDVVPASKWISWARENGLSAEVPFAKLKPLLEHLSEALKFRIYFSEDNTTIGIDDLYIYAALKGSNVWAKLSKEVNPAYEDLSRWYAHMSRQAIIADTVSELGMAALSLKGRQKDQASYEIDLKDAIDGQVVTRFPPEPSGYLHIGHAKAAMLNEYFARKYHGRLIVRFDDTNPSKENCEFEDAILEDLLLMGIQSDTITHTSDYFERLLDTAEEMIKQGLAYCDDTPQEQMREQRGVGIATACRDNSVEENLRRYGEMRRATAEGLRNCVRAKMSVDAANKALRDPVMVRCNLTPHHRTGTRFMMYPTYDFACPLVDSWEGVTHALRTSEYHDRNDQYAWFQSALGIRRVHIWDYSRLNFVYTLLSKRKLTWFVNERRVSGWDDPRFPTIRGILRRGLQMAALREYILMQGPSKNTLLLEWDKLWAVNKKLIDPIAPRHTALNTTDLVKVQLEEFPADHASFKSIPCHKKNPKCGEKLISFSPLLFLEQADARECSVGEHVTLMDWGNIVITDIRRLNNVVVEMRARLDLAGDVKITAKKLTWLSPDPHPLIAVSLHDYDYLITKRKLEEDDSLSDCLTPVTEFVTQAVGDCNLRAVKRGTVVQLERKGFYICDVAWTAEKPSVRLIAIPDGRTKSTQSKASQQ